MPIFNTRLLIPVVIIIMISVTNCALPVRTENPKGDGVGLPDENVGILYGLASGECSIDGIEIPTHSDDLQLFYDRIKLVPGDHTINYSTYFYKRGSCSSEMILNVESGHKYELKEDGCYWCSPFKCAIWIVDITNKEVISGHTPDWPSWMW